MTRTTWRGRFLRCGHFLNNFENLNFLKTFWIFLNFWFFFRKVFFWYFPRLTFKHNFTKRASYHSEFIRQGFTYLNHQWNADNSLCLMLCLWHIMIQFFVEAIKLDLYNGERESKTKKGKRKSMNKTEEGGGRRMMMLLSSLLECWMRKYFEHNSVFICKL